MNLARLAGSCVFVVASLSVFEVTPSNAQDHNKIKEIYINAASETQKSRPITQIEKNTPSLLLSDRITIRQEEALRSQLINCWNRPVGARNAQELIVEVLIDVNEDRTVRSAQIVDQVRYNTDSHFRAAAEAAMRALRHPKCTPLELPPDQYEQWKTIRFNFDPRDML